MTHSDPNLYDFWPYQGRPKIRWPGGKKLAFWIAPNIEYYEFSPPANPKRQPWPRPNPGYHRLFPAHLGEYDRPLAIDGAVGQIWHEGVDFPVRWPD